MEHPASSLARRTRAHSPGTTRTGPESWSIKTAIIDMTFLRTDTVQYHRDAETHRSRETTWWAPEGPQIVLSNVVSNEFNQWLTQAASLSTDDITVVLRQTPSELSDDSTGLPPHSDRVRHMAYENERRVRRRLLGLEESPSVAMVSNPHHPPGGCNLE